MKYKYPEAMVSQNQTISDRIILHFDYDCFYASCFTARDPKFKTLPIGVKQKGILATCNYVARARGVKKLMLISEARKLCPDIVILNGEDLSPFRDTSKVLYRFLRSYSWNGCVERLGLDEVFLDVSDMVDYNVQLLNPQCPEQSFFHLSSSDPEKGFLFDATTLVGCVWPPESQSSQEAQGRGLDMKDSNPSGTRIRLTIASYLASHLRAKIEQDYFLTASCGISTNKLLAKLSGEENKPNNQTTLLATDRNSILAFMGQHSLRKVPGIGSKISHLLEDHVHGPVIAVFPLRKKEREDEGGWGKQEEEEEESPPSRLTVADVRLHKPMSPALMTQILESRPGAEKGLGDKIWGLLHGIDTTPVKQAVDVPTQISIEDTYKGINTLQEVVTQLGVIALSLLRRMQVDLVEEEEEEPGLGAASDGMGGGGSRRRWIAHPKTLRLTTRFTTSGAGSTMSSPSKSSSLSSSNLSNNFPTAATRNPFVSSGTASRGQQQKQHQNQHIPQQGASTTATQPGQQQHGWGGRTSRSQPVPNFIFSLKEPPERVVERLVLEALLPMFRRLCLPQQGWNIVLINICVANMVVAGSSSSTMKGASGRDIGVMFRTQDEVLKEWTVYDESPQPGTEGQGGEDKMKNVEEEEEQQQMQLDRWEDDDGRYGGDLMGERWEEEEDAAATTGAVECLICGHNIPFFALEAHQRYHQLGD